MSRRLTKGKYLAAVLTISLLAACGNSDQNDVETTTALVNPTTTTAITTTTVPTSTSSTVSEVSDVEPPGEGEPWDILFLGFDDVFTRVPGQLYADQLAEELGVEMRLFEPPGFDHVYAATLVEQLRGDRYPPLGDYVPPAEVIVLLSRPGESLDNEDEYITQDFGRCWWRSPEGVPPTSELTGEYWTVYRRLLDDVYTELWDLRQDQPTLIITLDLYNPSLQLQRDSGIEEACVAWFESWRAQLDQAAEAHGSVFLSLQDVFNGPDHQLDPAEAGLIGPTEADPSAPWYRSTPLGASEHAAALVTASLEALNAP